MKFQRMRYSVAGFADSTVSEAHQRWSCWLGWWHHQRLTRQQYFLRKRASLAGDFVAIAYFKLTYDTLLHADLVFGFSRTLAFSSTLLAENHEHCLDWTYLAHLYSAVADFASPVESFVGSYYFSFQSHQECHQDENGWLFGLSWDCDAMWAYSHQIQILECLYSL